MTKKPPLQTPVVEVPVLLLILLATLVTYLRVRKMQLAYVAPTVKIDTTFAGKKAGK